MIMPVFFLDISLISLNAFDFRLCRVHRRIQKGFDVFEYYANNQWDFDNTNLLYLRTIINDVERKKYSIQDDSNYIDP